MRVNTGSNYHSCSWQSGCNHNYTYSTYLPVTNRYDTYHQSNWCRHRVQHQRTIWQTTTTFSGVAAGGYTVRARYTADPTCESTQAVTITAALGSPGAITTTLTQPTCLVPTGTIAVTAPLGAGIEYSINGTVWQATTTFSGVAAGGYTVRARYTADPTCESTQAVTITAALGSPGAIATTLTQPTCLLPTGTILITSPTGAGIEYSINGTVWQSTTTFSGVAAGGYTVRARYTADPTCESTQAVTITAALGSPGAITTTLTQPTCLVPTGTIAVTAPLGAGIEYSINGTSLADDNDVQRSCGRWLYGQGTLHS